jgi:hypothetical protein
MMPSMRAILTGLCGLTLAASAWLGTMFVVLHRPGYERGFGMSVLFALQSLLALAVARQWVSGGLWRAAAVAGAAGLVWTGTAALTANLTAPHFEGFALIVGLLLVLQGLLTAGHLIPSVRTQSS